MNPLLFGGATARKRFRDGTNHWGNDYEATQYLSNYAALPVPVVFDGVKHPSTEQAYVAAKFGDRAVGEFIAGLQPGVNSYGQLTSPAQEARNLGQSSSVRRWRDAGWTGSVPRLRADWSDVKVGIMEELVKQKFNNNPDFAQYLLATGDRELIEHTTGWGSRYENGQRIHHGDRVWGMADPVVVDSINSAIPKEQKLTSRDAQADRLEGENFLGRALMKARAELGGTGLVGRHAPPAVETSATAMPEQPAAVAKPTGQQVADGVQLDFWEEGKRMAGQAFPYIAAAGGAGLLGYAVADLYGRSNEGGGRI